MTPARNLRLIGLGLIVAGVSIGGILESIARVKAQMSQTRAKLLTRVEEPGVIAVMLGVALLDASDTPELQMQRRSKK